MNEAQITAWRRRQDEKAAAQRRFRELEVAAAASQIEARRVERKAPKKKPVPQLAEPRTPRVTQHVRAPRPCKVCGVMVRPPKSLLSEFPGTAKGARVDLCALCADGGPIRHKTPPTCAQCDVPLYRRRDEPRPGARRHAGKGLCTRCYSAAQR